MCDSLLYVTCSSIIGQAGTELEEDDAARHVHPGAGVFLIYPRLSPQPPALPATVPLRTGGQDGVPPACPSPDVFVIILTIPPSPTYTALYTPLRHQPGQSQTD